MQKMTTATRAPCSKQWWEILHPCRLGGHTGQRSRLPSTKNGWTRDSSPEEGARSSGLQQTPLSKLCAPCAHEGSSVPGIVLSGSKLAKAPMRDPVDRHYQVALGYPALASDPKSGVWIATLAQPLVHASGETLDLVGPLIGSSPIICDDNGSVWIADPIKNVLTRSGISLRPVERARCLRLAAAPSGKDGKKGPPADSRPPINAAK